MKSDLSITTTEEIFRLRNFLQQISHVSFTFAKINRDYPIDNLSEKEGEEVLVVYRNLLNDCEAVIKNYKDNLNLNKNGKDK